MLGFMNKSKREKTQRICVRLDDDVQEKAQPILDARADTMSNMVNQALRHYLPVLIEQRADFFGKLASNAN